MSASIDKNKKVDVDLFTLDIVRDSLLAIGEEMFVALARTSMSPIIYEVLDYASGLIDAKGNLLTQGNGATGFIGRKDFHENTSGGYHAAQKMTRDGKLVSLPDWC